MVTGKKKYFIVIMLLICMNISACISQSDNRDTVSASENPEGKESNQVIDNETENITQEVITDSYGNIINVVSPSIETTTTIETAVETAEETMVETMEQTAATEVSIQDTEAMTNVADTAVTESVTESASQVIQSSTQSITQAVSKPVTYDIAFYTPVQSQTSVYNVGGYSVDYSNTADGYIMVCNGNGNNGAVMMLYYNGTYYSRYDIISGTYETFNLTKGDGTYTIRIMEPTGAYDANGNALYSAKGALDINVTLSASTKPFLYPTQRVAFGYSSTAVQKSYELCYGLTTDAEKVNAIYNFIISNIVYDYNKAGQITSGQITSYIPNADATLSSKTGICSDYSALFAVMCRAQQIPAIMVYGTVDGYSHAWNKIYYNGVWNFYDATYAASKSVGKVYTENNFY